MYKDERHGLKDYKIENTVEQQKKVFHRHSDRHT